MLVACPGTGQLASTQQCQALVLQPDGALRALRGVVRTWILPEQAPRQRFGKHQEGVRREPNDAFMRALHNWGSALLGTL